MKRLICIYTYEKLTPQLTNNNKTKNKKTSTPLVKKSKADANSKINSPTKCFSLQLFAIWKGVKVLRLVWYYTASRQAMLSSSTTVLMSVNCLTDLSSSSSSGYLPLSIFFWIAFSYRGSLLLASKLLSHLLYNIF